MHRISGDVQANAQIDAKLAPRRFTLIDLGNRLATQILQREWNDKLHILVCA
jgi:hypothetical protein